MSTDSTAAAQGQSTARRGRILKIVLLSAVLALAVAGFVKFGGPLSLERLAANESSLRLWQQDHPVLVRGLAFTIYVGFTGLSVPGAAGLTLFLGWFFGFWEGFVMASLAATTGATLAFLTSRYLLRDFVQQRFGPRLKAFNEALHRDGPFYLFALRLIPVVPYFMVNLVMGLTPIRLATYCWVSWTGMLAGSAVYAYAGSTLPSLRVLAERGAAGVLSPRILVALVLLGLFPFFVRQAVAWFRRRG